MLRFVMEAATQQIYINNMRQHAYHGVLPQERIIGNDYVINVVVDYPIMTACLSDNVIDTLNYADLGEVVKEQMLIQSNLLEHVAYRICDAILKRFRNVTAVSIDIVKVAPPMPIDCNGAGVRLTLKR